jgi:hypothetical protein
MGIGGNYLVKAGYGFRRIPVISEDQPGLLLLVKRKTCCG